MTHVFRAALLAVVMGVLPAQAETALKFSSLQQDHNAPVNVDADSLSVDQSSGVATFSGAVHVTQGQMTITADKAVIRNAPNGGAVEVIELTGGVTFTTPDAKATADGAVYTVSSGQVVMTGSVVLVQQGNTMRGQKLTANLSDGTGVLEGRVSTTFVPKQAAKGTTP